MWLGQRGEETRRTSFYKVFPSGAGNGKWSLESYLTGASNGGNFETKENAQEYAELDFAEWLRRFGLKDMHSA